MPAAAVVPVGHAVVLTVLCYCVQARRMESELDGKMDSLIKLSTDLSNSGSAADLEAGPLLGEAQMMDRLQDEIKAALGTTVAPVHTRDRIAIHGSPASLTYWAACRAACLDKRRDAAGIRRQREGDESTASTSGGSG